MTTSTGPYVLVDGAQFPLYTQEFASDPHGHYREMRRRYGSLVPVQMAPGIPATLVIGYHDAVRILNDPEHFPADPRIWQQNVPADCPVKPMMEWYPNVLRNAGDAHRRYRQANVHAVDGVDLHGLHAIVEREATPLINTFCESGSAELISQYAFPLVFAGLNDMLGCPPEIGQRVAAGMAALFDSVDENAELGMQLLSGALLELIELKKREPGDDMVTRLLQHGAGLDDTEMLANIISLYGAGLEPQQNLIINTLRLILTDDRFAGDVLGGSLSTRDALDEVLFNDPPMANFAISYPRQPMLIGETWLPAHQPVVISLAGCNNDPAIGGGERIGNRSHLAWSLGPHACPAKSVATLVAQEAIDQLLDALPELRLAVPVDELSWRAGPFHRALAALPVVFPASPPLNVK
ncbi:cytochrome P450 [Nocardia sp. SYP-A9097]|uniref:cytochrome P450 n=1 Tax=Nocardia sp. SYP-A9097 TaxID=2663237 RepID=UPI00129AB138|nr:cytochrome P450 [Nocardia sp. SYP-A9097]MRH88165.1 cytochrome P450 [Nocardia sp. SYP-A9097]